MRTRIRGRLRRSARRLAGLLSTLYLIGCGSGGGGGPIAPCDFDSFTPNYARRLTRLRNWESFPIKVFFVRDAEFSTTRRATARAGFDQWVEATDGKISYTEVSTADAAHVTVRFDPTNDDGVTTSHFTGLRMDLAEVSIGVKDQPPADLQCVSAYEFGHALGIDGHSEDENDLMYSVHFIGRPCPITGRDLNTIKTGYCHLYGRSATCETRCAEGASGTVTIR